MHNYKLSVLYRHLCMFTYNDKHKNGLSQHDLPIFLCLFVCKI